MPILSLDFAINHMAAPQYMLGDFFQLAASLQAPRVEIRNVSFRYPGGGPVFENLDLRLMPDQRIGLTPGDGAGLLCVGAGGTLWTAVGHGGNFGRLVEVVEGRASPFAEALSKLSPARIQGVKYDGSRRAQVCDSIRIDATR